MDLARSERITTIFGRAVDLPGPERSKLLDEECRDDPDLRREIDALLLQHERPSSFLDESSLGQWSGVAASVARAAAGQALVGRAIGRYRVDRLIAAGGMGTVYEATQENPRRAVALKVVQHAAATPDALRRFQDEAAILARLRHPGIAQVFEAGVLPDELGGLPWIAMEFVPDARPITEFAHERKLPLRARLDLFRAFCDAVRHAHQRGVIHRDLKPANLLVDGTGQPKVIDFGVARRADPAASQHTGAGALIGTLAYMSPEHCGGDPHDLDVRADVYSMGVVLYELLCQRPPLDLANQPLHEALRRIRETAPVAPGSLRRELRGDLENIVLKALEKEPARRYATLADLADDLGRVLRHEAVTATRPSLPYRTRKFVRRHRVGVTAGATVAAALLAGAALAVRGQFHLLRGQAEAVRGRDEAEAVISFLEDMLAHANPVAAGEDVSLRKVLGETEQRIARLSDRPLVEARLRHTIGVAYDGIGDRFTAERHMRRALELREQELGPDHEETLRTVRKLVDLEDKAGHREKALALSQRLLTALRAREGERAATTLEERGMQGEILSNLGRKEEAESMLRTTLADAEAALGSSHKVTAYLHNRLAVLLFTLERYVEAAEHLETALATCRVCYPPGDLHTMGAAADLATQYNELRRFEEALTLIDEVLAAERAVLPEDHPRIADALEIRSASLDSLARFDDAETAQREVVEIRRKMLGPRHDATIKAIHNLACRLHAAGRLAEAEPLYAEALDLRIQMNRWSDEQTLTTANNLALLYGAQGRQDKALELLERALKELSADDPGNARMRLKLLPNVGAAYYRMARLDDAERCFVEAREILQRTPDADEELTIQVLNALGMLYGQRHEMERCEPLVREAAERARRHYGAGDEHALTTEMNLGLVLERMGRVDDAFEKLEAVLAACREKLGPGHEATRSAMKWLATTCINHGRPEQAIDLYLELIGLHEADGSINLPVGQQAIEFLAKIYDASGQPEKAVEWRAKLRQ